MAKKTLWRTGFTIIELLIVIGIISILAVALLIGLNPAESQRRARDAKRLKDMNTIQTLIGQYLNDGGTPPSCSGSSPCTSASVTGTQDTCASSNWLTIDLCTYTKTIPVDPVNGTTRTCVDSNATNNITTGCSMAYEVAFSGSDYEINAKLESPSNVAKISGDSGDASNRLELFASSGSIISGNQGLTEAINGTGLSFDGVDDYVSLSQTSSATAFTWSVWIYPTDVTKDQMFLGGAPDTAFYFRINTQRPQLSIRTTVSQRTLTSSTNLQNNTWYHLVAMYDGTTMRIYLNGTQLVAGVLSETLQPWGIGRFGRWRDSDQRSFVGKIDDIRMYTRALTATEVANLYAGQDITSGLTNRWNLNQGSGTTATDSVGGANGTVSGATWY